MAELRTEEDGEMATPAAQRSGGEQAVPGKDTELNQAQADSFKFHSIMGSAQTQASEFSRLKPAQVLALASTEQQAAGLVSKPELLSQWVDSYLSVAKKDARIVSSLEKFVLPALRKEIIHGRDAGSEEEKRRFVRTLSELSRLKEANAKIGPQVLRSEEFLQIASSRGMEIPQSVFERWYKKDAAELSLALNWIKERLNSAENEQGKISSLATLIPHKDARQLFLDHKAASTTGLQPQDLGMAIFGLEPQAAAEIVELNLGRFPKREEALASVLLSLPAKTVNKYLDEISRSKSASFLGPLTHLSSGFSNSPQEGLDRKRIATIFSDIQALTLERTRRLLKENQNPVYEELQTLLRSPELADRENYLTYQAKTGSITAWNFSDAAAGLSPEKQIKLLDTFTDSLEFGKKEPGLEALKELPSVMRSAKLMTALESKLQALKQNQEKQLAQLLEVPEPDIEKLNAWKAKDTLLKFKGTETVQASRLKEGLRTPIGGWKYKEGQYSDLLEQVSENYSKEVNVYTFMHGKQEVELRVDKTFEDEMRQAGANKDDKGRSRVLPEELASLVLETIPATGHLRLIELTKTPQPERYVHPENPAPGHNPTTEAAADALIEGGRIRFFHNFRFGFVSLLKHEYKHLLQKESGFKTYQEAVKFESRKWQGDNYGYTNDMEDWAVNGGERALGKDSARFVQFARQAPARALASLAVIEQVLKKADSLDEGQRKALLQRIEFGEQESLPRFQREMEASLASKDYPLLKQQFAFLAHLGTDSQKPSWAARVLESSEPLKKLFAEPISDPELRNHLFENLVQLSAILENRAESKDNIYTQTLNRELPALRAQFLELSSSAGNGERKAYLKELAVSIRSKNPDRGLELVSDAEFVKMLGKDYFGQRGLDGWYQAARREGRESGILDLLQSKGENANLLLSINDLKARFKYADGTETLSKYDLKWLLLNLDNNSRLKFLESRLHKFPDRDEALNYALSELPPSWQKRQLELFAQTQPASALDSLKTVIDKGPNNDLEVLKSAQALYMNLKKAIPAAILKKLEAGDIPLSYAEVNALRHDDSLESRALSMVLGTPLLSSVSKGLSSPDRAQILALYIAQQRLDRPERLFEELKQALAYKNDANYKLIVDRALNPAAQNEPAANPELAGLILKGDALKAYFRTTDAILDKPDLPAQIIRLAKALDPDGKETEAAIKELSSSLKARLEKALSISDINERERGVRGILQLALKIWQADPKYGAMIISPVEAAQAFQIKSYRTLKLAKEWFSLSKETQDELKIKSWLQDKINSTSDSYERSRIAELYFAFKDPESRREGLQIQAKTFGKALPASVAEALAGLEKEDARKILAWQLQENPGKKTEILLEAFLAQSTSLGTEILEQLKDARSPLVAIRLRNAGDLAEKSQQEFIKAVYRNNLAEALQDIDKKLGALSEDELELLSYSDDIRHRLRFLKEERIGRVSPHQLVKGLSEAAKKELLLEYLKKAPIEERERLMENQELRVLLTQK